MKPRHRTTLGYQFGTKAVESRLTDIALLMKTAFPDYAWHHESETEHPNARRLDIHGPSATTSVFFTNRELLTYSNVKRRCALDRRMFDALCEAFYAQGIPPFRARPRHTGSHIA